MKKIPILLIGPYPEGKFLHIGGATILFKNFIDFLKKKSIVFSFISIIKFHGYGNRFINFFYIIGISLWKLPGSKIVILNFNRRGLLYLAPFLFLYAKLFKVKVILRMFGQNALEISTSSSSVFRYVAGLILKKADLLFFETINEVTYFQKLNSNTYWFPNCRNYPLFFNLRKYKKRFIFISQIKIDKGVRLLLDVFRQLGSDYLIDIYGPILDSELLFIKDLSCYKGTISFDEVYGVLDKYDVLLLPTFYAGEGYPGILIEAYAMSVPVITTRWKSIPEIVTDGESGYLIEPNSENSLKEAILKLNEENYSLLNMGAFEMSKKFQSDDVHERVLAIVQQLIKN